MKHLMIDLETLGQTPGCSIFSIGIVPFCLDRGQVFKDEGIYVLINPESCIDVGLFEEPETVDWWSRQSPEARKELEMARNCNITIEAGLDLLDELVAAHDNGQKTGVRVWGNGSDFDNAILSAAYYHANKGIEGKSTKVPWKFFNNRCFRTLKSMAPKTLLPARKGTHHNAFDDAVYQAECACAIARHVGVAQWPGL